MTQGLLHVPASVGRPKLEGRVILKIGADETGGAFTLCWSRTPPGLGPPLHVHELEDETFYVVRGTYELQFGHDRVVAGPGSCIHLPRYTPHTFRNIGAEWAELVEFMTPGGIERYFDAVEHLGPILTDPDERSAIGHPFGIGFPTSPDAVIDPPAGETRRPIEVTPPGGGRPLDLAGFEARCVMELSATATALGLVEVDVPAGFEGSVVMPDAASLVVVLDGRLVVGLGSDRVVAEVDDAVAVLDPGELAVASNGRSTRFLLYSVGPTA